MSEKYLKVAIKAATEAGNKLKSLYGKTTSRKKEDKSIVTEADLSADLIIKKYIRSNFQDHSILSEESGFEDLTSDFLWIIDPLDGSTNFSVQNPFFAVSIALLIRNKPYLGVVYSPIQEELFYAVINKKAYLNSNLIEVDSRSSIDSSFISFANGRDHQSRLKMVQIYQNLKLRNNMVRQVGAASLELCYVASGRFGAFIMPGLNSWDVLGGALILNEAHGITTDFKGNKFDFHSVDILGGSPSIHHSLLEAIVQSLYEN